MPATGLGTFTEVANFLESESPKRFSGKQIAKLRQIDILLPMIWDCLSVVYGDASYNDGNTNGLRKLVALNIVTAICNLD